MATGRKRWFAVEDRILNEIQDPEDRGIVVGLIALANQQWATERPAHPDEVALRPPGLHAVTGRERSRAGLARLRQALRTTSARVSQEDGYVLVKWPKLLEIQKWPARPAPGSRPRNAPSEPSPEPVQEEHPSGGAAPRSRLLNLLSKKEGSEEEKLAFLAESEEIILARAEAECPANGRARSAKVRELTLRFWNARQRGYQRSSDGPSVKEALGL